MLDLHRKKIISVVLLLSCVFHAHAQKEKPIYQADYDAKIIHFGYFMGLSVSNYRLRFKPEYVNQINMFIPAGGVLNDSLLTITSPTSTGLKVGALMNYHLNDHFDFRIVPTVAIYGRKVLLNDNPENLKIREQAWFELPFFLRYKSMRRQNYRMNMLAGVRAGFETNAVNLVSKTKINKQAGLRSADLSVEYGVGLELFYNFFKLVPELHFSHGIRNMSRRVSVPASGTPVNPLSLLKHMNTHTVTFYMFFE